jgi:hypothetical protein
MSCQSAVAKPFGVEAIPHTFTIDPDGNLQDEHTSREVRPARDVEPSRYPDYPVG